MNEQSFKANDWLEPVFSPRPLELESESHFLDSGSTKFLPASFLVPGWTGDGLTSKTAYSIKTTSEILWKYSLELFSTFKDSNNNFKNLVFNEFSAYIKCREELDLEYNSAIDFWPDLFLEPEKQKDEVKNFKNIYCYRAVINYLYRIQFLTSLCKALFIKPTENNLLNPSSFFTKIFQQGGPRELTCESLQANSYSWFRPDSGSKETVAKIAKDLENISTIEFLKIFSNLPGMENIPEFSHTLSHKNFGEFLNHLLINFPQWITGNINQAPEKFLNTKFNGDFLCSLTNSFWLGQGSKEAAGSTIIIPDFIGEAPEEGNFLKICQELQFLTFLSNLSNRLGKEPADLISQTFKQKHSKTADGIFGQMNLFSNKNSKNEIHYDRIVINFSKIPKKNPHHSLINLINLQIPCLNKNGFLFVFSNQNLFVSSHTERVQDLLQSFKLEAYFNLERLKGKGEITSFLYVLRKRNNKEAISGQTIEQKESCLSFRWNGNLSSFYNFHQLNKEFDFFLKNKSPFSNSIYHRELSQELSFEFLQDAVLDGVLLHSSSNDTSKLAHPNFFKNLTKYCMTFENFFKIESIDPQEDSDETKNDLTLELLGKKVRKEEKFPFILVANLTDLNNIRIEIIPSSSYIAKVEENGYACFQYFGLIPKKHNLSINLFREYFQTDLGLQIIQIYLSTSTKLKSKIKSILIPNFFLPENNLNLDLRKDCQFLEYPSTTLINTHPEQLLKSFENFKTSLDDLLNISPLRTLEGLTNFKLNLEMALSWIYGQSNATQNFKYTNPIIKESLSNLKVYPLYPSNNEIHLEILVTTREDLAVRLSHTSLKQNDSSCFIELCSNKGPILEIHSDQEILNFIQFILNSAVGLPISTVISCLNVPKIKDLKISLSNFEKINTSLNQLLNEAKEIISYIFMQKISSINKGITH